jgi:hypothetical protein
MEPSPKTDKIAAVASTARLARDSGFEVVLTAVLLFGVVTIVRWVIGPSPISRAIPEMHAQLVIVGVAVGLLLAGLILSPVREALWRSREPCNFAWQCGALEFSRELAWPPTSSLSCSAPYLG